MKKLKILLVLTALLLSKGLIAEHSDTSINCLIFVNDKVLLPRECQNFILTSTGSMQNNKIDTISLLFNIGTLSLKVSDYALIKKNNDAKLMFDYFYTNKEKCCIKKGIELNSCLIIFDNHKYIIMRIYDMELRKNKRRFSDNLHQGVIFSYETEGAARILSEDKKF